MNDASKYFLTFIAGAVAMIMAAFCVAKCTHSNPEGETIIQRDTLVIHDTVRIEKPVAKIVRTVDTMLVFAVDTVVMRDTLFVRIPVEQKVFSDSLYKLQVSGYRPSLDWIEVYPTTIKVTETIQEKSRKRWGVGVQVGYGVALNDKQVVLSPYIGLGISYHFIRW